MARRKLICSNGDHRLGSWRAFQNYVVFVSRWCVRQDKASPCANLVVWLVPRFPLRRWNWSLATDYYYSGNFDASQMGITTGLFFPVADFTIGKPHPPSWEIFQCLLGKTNTAQGGTCGVCGVVKTHDGSAVMKTVFSRSSAVSRGNIYRSWMHLAQLTDDSKLWKRVIFKKNFAFASLVPA